MAKPKATSYDSGNPGSPTDRRRYKRYAYQSEIKLYNTEYELLDTVKVTNLGLGGMRFSTKLFTLIEGSQVVLELQGRNPVEKLTLLGEVRYNLAGDQKSIVCGLAFLSMNNDLSSHLQSLLTGCPEISR